MLAAPLFRAADGADVLPHAASDADFFFNAALDLRDQVGVLLRPQQIGPALQPAVFVARRSDPGGLPHHLGPVDAGGLPLGGPLVVKDAALSQKQLAQPLQCGTVEPLEIPVHLIVTEADAECVHLFLCQVRLGKLIDER